MKTLDWQTDRNSIIEHVLRTNEPLKVKSFFLNNKRLPHSNPDFLSRFPDLPIQTVHENQEEFIKSIRERNYNSPVRNLTTISEYYKLATQSLHVLHNIKCYEDLVPEFIAKEIDSNLSSNDLLKIKSENYLSDFYYRFFYGLKGQDTAPHFDWAPYNSILFQIYGQKKVHLYPPETFVHFPFYYNTIDLSLVACDELAKLNSLPQECLTIEEGEGLYIPPYYAHSVEYPSDSSSLSLRFLPNKILGKLHHSLPASAPLAQIFSSLYRDMLPLEEFTNRLMSVKRFEEFTAIVKETSLRLFGYYIECSEAALDYEKHMFYQLKSFDHQLFHKVRRKEILERGAAHFSNF